MSKKNNRAIYKSFTYLRNLHKSVGSLHVMAYKNDYKTEVMTLVLN